MKKEYVVQFEDKTLVFYGINLLDVFTQIKSSKKYYNKTIVRIRTHCLKVLFGEPLPKDNRITYVGVFGHEAN